MEGLLGRTKGPGTEEMEVAVATVWDHEQEQAMLPVDCVTDSSDDISLSDGAESEDTLPPAKRGCSESPSYWETPSECAEPSSLANDNAVTDVPARASVCRDVLARRRKSLAYVLCIHFFVACARTAFVCVCVHRQREVSGC